MRITGKPKKSKIETGVITYSLPR